MKTYLDVRFDVTDLSDDERGALALEVAVQAEESDFVGDDGHGWTGHRGVEAPEIEWNEVEEEVEMKRTILVHLNVEVPSTDTRSPDEIADAILAAIEVGSDDESVRNLGIGGLASGNGAPINCTLAEEV